MNYANPYGWYYNSPYDRSPSWTSVVGLSKFLLRTGGGSGPMGKIVPISQIERGDIIQLRQNPTHFNHSVIVSDIVGQDILVCAHSNNAKDKKLSSYQYLALLPIHITSG